MVLQEDLCEFKTNLAYKASSRIVRAVPERQKTKLEQKIIIMCMSVCLHVSVYHMCLLPMEASVGSLGVGGNVSLCVLLSHGNCFVGNT